MDEIWKDIDGYEGIYKVSNKGNIVVYSRIRNGYSYKAKKDTLRMYKEKQMKISKGDRYLFVVLRKDGKYKTLLLHRIIALAFIPNPLSKPNINHIDFNSFNNSIDNLEWCTQYENIHCTMNAGRSKYATGDKNPKSKINNNQVKQIFELKKNNISQKQIAIMFNVDASIISKILTRKTYKCVSL